MNHTEREETFVRLFEDNRSSIRRLCFGFLNSACEVDDLFQEIMTNAWNALPKFRGDSKISTWLYRIAVNTALVHRRRRRPSEELHDLPDQRAGAHQNLEQQERLTHLRQAIAQLPDQDRLIVTLLLEGLSYKEIADITGITVNYVGVKINRIKQMLEHLMTEVGYGAV